ERYRRRAERRYDPAVPMRATIIVLILLGNAACSDSRLGVKIPFAVVYGEQAITCDSPSTTLTDLRFFISDLALLDGNGRREPVVLDDQYQWQQSDLAFIDLENGGSACENGTVQVYSYLVGSVPAGDYNGIVFTVGVPFERNHANPLTAAAPLDIGAMHWHWRSGYKFLRAGIRTPAESFWLHLGSAGCEGTTANVSACRFPNRVMVELPGFLLRHDTIAIDLEALFAGVNLLDGEPGDCSSGPAETSCAAPFLALGIDFESGETVRRQQVFSLRQ
ncbi:MAG: metallo-mystery pair system four-Cys motif protein, partial [Gammaproteobacteria bacterium]|nr:metallo-mystery pair system four-Cys motif protein [Gammaproteobacteria bacterium]